MSEERAPIVSRMLPEYDDTITRAQYRPDVAPLPPSRPRPEPVLLDDVDESWRPAAACVGQPEQWFFPPLDFDHPKPGVVTVEMRDLEDQAKQVCATCIVRGACLTFALANDEEFGVWGGLDPRERSELRVAAGMTQHRLDRWARRKRRRDQVGSDIDTPPRRISACRELTAA